MDNARSILVTIIDLVIFVIISILFIPAFLIVTIFQPVWSDKLSELFGL